MIASISKYQLYIAGLLVGVFAVLTALNAFIIIRNLKSFDALERKNETDMVKIKETSLSNVVFHLIA
ncbi:MAG: hypothetical protein J2P52_10740 [Blastocatellia bacterium]|nr:hypothetical protein [Blastocatellia bacterium]